MASTGAQRTHVRLAAALLASLLAASAVLTYLSYTSAFSSYRQRHASPRRAPGWTWTAVTKSNTAAFRLARSTTSVTPDQAQLTLDIDSGQLRYIPANAAVHIASNTIFGAKSVEFIPPKSPWRTRCARVRIWRSRRYRWKSIPCSSRSSAAAQDRPSRAERDVERRSPKVCVDMAMISARCSRG